MESLRGYLSEQVIIEDDRLQRGVRIEAARSQGCQGVPCHDSIKQYGKGREIST